jgi:CDP-paratose 2-epimerase
MSSGPVLITGGAGFVGSNLADSLLRDGHEVIIYDALARRGVEANLTWLTERYGNRVSARIADIRDKDELDAAVREAGAVVHLAAQVAVTTSLESPEDDFTINGQGTLNLLEAVRRHDPEKPVIFASTNKVYGHLHDIEMVADEDRHIPADAEIRTYGISEKQPLDFATPYGCSKGVADQYVLDYTRTFGLNTAVLRMSCIYGPRQFGTEDQGWVAHFLIRALAGDEITIYGDGRQVRDVLHVSDAVAAYRALLADITRFRGRVFNLGGGPDNAVSLRIMLREIEAITGQPLNVQFSDWRAGDQLFFVADTRQLQNEAGWLAAMGWRDGLRDLARWIGDHHDIIGIARPAERLKLHA